MSTSHKNAFLDNPRINTCSVDNSELNLQVRYFTNFEFDINNKEFAYLTKNSEGVSIKEQKIELSEEQEGIYVYFITLSLKPTLNKSNYGIKLILDKNYVLEGLTNANYEMDPKNLFTGMDYINEYKRDMITSILFDESYDIEKIKVNNVLNEIDSNETAINDKGIPYISAKGDIKAPQIIGYTYSYGGKTYCADNEVQYKEYSLKELKNKLK